MRRTSGDERSRRASSAAGAVAGAAQPIDVAEIDLEHRVHVGRRLLAVDHVLGDLLAHHAERRDRAALAFGEVRSRATDRSTFAGADGPAFATTRSLGRFGALLASGRFRCTALERSKNVVLGDAAPDAGAGDGADVYVMLAGDAADQRRRPQPSAVAALDRRRFGVARD